MRRTTIRKVVDTNQLRDPVLRSYLSRSPTNLAVLPDYTAMEAYKGDTLANIFDSMEILADFPEQVIVLKGTQRICGLSGREAGLQRRLVDRSQTSGFTSFCADFERARRGDRQLQAQLLEHSREASKFLDDTMLVKAADILTGMEIVARETYTESELKNLRGEELRLSVPIAGKILVSVFVLASSLFEEHPTQKKWPKDLATFRNTFPFRYALCAYLLLLEWISTGSVTTTNPKRIRNDMVDVGIAAYATYFDGLLSKDGKATRIYHHAMAILETVLASPSSELTNEWLAAVRNFARESEMEQ